MAWGRGGVAVGLGDGVLVGVGLGSGVAVRVGMGVKVPGGWVGLAIGRGMRAMAAVAVAVGGDGVAGGDTAVVFPHPIKNKARLKKVILTLRPNRCFICYSPVRLKRSL